MTELTNPAIQYLSEFPADDDLVHIVDRSDHSQTSEGSSKKIRHDKLVGAASARSEITNSFIIQPIDLQITSDGVNITASLGAVSGTVLTLIFSSGFVFLDVTTPITVTLTPGTSTVPQENWLYILESAPTVLVSSTTGYPDDTLIQYAPIGRIIVQDAISVQSDGVLKQHNYNNLIKSAAEMGVLNNIIEWIRERWATYISGISPTVSGTGTGTISYSVTAGVVRHLFDQTFPAFSSPATLYAINDYTTKYKAVTNLGADILTDSLGGALTDRYYSLIIWGVASETGSGQSKLFINVPSGSYDSETLAKEDLNRYANYSISNEFKGCAFLIQKVLLKNNSDTTFDVISITDGDLRGKIPNYMAGIESAVGTEFGDSTFRIFNNTDNTKKVGISCANITTGNTRIITAADRNLDLADPVFDTLTLSNTINEISTSSDFSGATNDQLKTALAIKTYIEDSLPLEYHFVHNVISVGQPSFALPSAPDTPSFVKAFLNGTSVDYGVDFVVSGVTFNWLGRTLQIGEKITGYYNDRAITLGGTSVYTPLTTDFNANLGNVRVRSIAGTGGHRFTLTVPGDFTNLIEVSIRALVSAGASGTNRDIDFYTDIGTFSTVSNNIQHSDTTTLYDLSSYSNKYYDFVITQLYAGVNALDTVGLYIDHNGIGGSLYYTGYITFTYEY